MDLTQLRNSAEHVEAIRKFVRSELFLEIKDAFVSHTPEGSPDGNRIDDSAKNLGKFLATRYVFNEMERIATQLPVQENNNKKKGRSGGVDPDLES